MDNITFIDLFKNMLDGFAYCQMIYDNDDKPTNFIYKKVNKAFEELTGLHDVEGKLVTQVIPNIKELAPELIEIYGRVADTGVSQRFETFFIPLKMWFDVSVYSPRKGFFIALFDNVTDRKRADGELRMAYEATIEGWGRALELRDEVTEGHTERVARLTVQLARRLGVNEDEIIHMRRGALLHDVGKIGVPDSILKKPGALTKAERKIMERHPKIAYDLLSPIQYLTGAVDIPYCHHERVDGNGYPRGLRNSQIPFAARVFSVVDVWDALTSDRSYRKALGWDEALKIVSAGTGKQFDAKVIQVFLEMIREEH